MLHTAVEFLSSKFDSFCSFFFPTATFKNQHDQESCTHTEKKCEVLQLPAAISSGLVCILCKLLFFKLDCSSWLKIVAPRRPRTSSEWGRERERESNLKLLVSAWQVKTAHMQIRFFLRLLFNQGHKTAKTTRPKWGSIQQSAISSEFHSCRAETHFIGSPHSLTTHLNPTN